MTDDNDIAAKKSLEKAGLKKEGTIRKVHYCEGDGLIGTYAAS